ncbi:MAG: DEAD/DEAH box helicase [Halieaceae bacterium]|jgi:ATP-dependent RNA helicase RhlE|nr:DEAD/DEAH box helicase [Halieaceae bacterium]
MLMGTAMTFDDLGLAPDLVRATADQGYTTPTPIQAQAVPLVLDGRDVLAAAQTGTGKTGAFALPLLQRLAFVGKPRPKQVRALVLTPTRELALQVHESARAYAKYLELSCEVVFGGVKLTPQIRALAPGVDLLVATPGRLLDLSDQGLLHFDDLEVLVLDEADRMLDMGFIHDLRRIVSRLPKNRQTLMFSATFSADIRRLAGRYLDDPVQVQVAAENATADRVEQRAYHVDRDQKTPLLLHLLRQQQWHRALVFVRTKHGANRLSRRLESEGIKSAPIHGNKSQNARQRALEEFKGGHLQVLVATDIAARGLDIDQLPDVVNYDLPAVAEDYVHRIGRTGRAGAAGRSHSLVTPEDEALLRGIERLTGQRIPPAAVPGFTRAAPEVRAKESPRPRRRRRRSRAARSSDDRSTPLPDHRCLSA